VDCAPGWAFCDLLEQRFKAEVGRVRVQAIGHECEQRSNHARPGPDQQEQLAAAGEVRWSCHSRSGRMRISNGLVCSVFHHVPPNEHLLLIG
jgi:hypothetical protein